MINLSRFLRPIALVFVLSLGMTQGMAQSYIIGAASPAIGSSASFTALIQFLLFDVTNSGGVVIDSVDIYPTSTIGSPFTIVVQNSSSTVIASYSGTTTVTGGATPQRVKVNFSIPQGTGYRFGFSVNPGMIRNSTGAVYPYSVPGLMSITGNTFNVVYYYFFYNIRIMYPSVAGDAGIQAITNPGDTACSGSTPVSVTLKNYGSGTITSAQINWTVNTAAQPPYSWTGSLGTGATTSVTIGNYTFATGTTYNLTASSSLPNGVADLVPGNDGTSKNGIYVKTSPTATPLNTSYTICQGDSVQIGGTLTGTPPYTIVINDGTSNYTYPNLMIPGFAQYVSPLTTTTYTLTSLTDNSGCINTSTPPIVVTVNPSPAAVITPAGPTTFCDGGSVVLQAQQGSGYAYAWKKDGLPVSGATSPSLVASTSGSYELVTTLGNCNRTSTPEIVTAKPLPGFDLGQDTVICANSSIYLNGGSGMSAYLWSTGATSSFISVDSTGIGIGSVTISVLVTLNGCEKSDTVSIEFVDCTVISEMDDAGLVVYPNPASDFLKLDMNGFPLPLRFALTDIQGRTVLEFDAEGDMTVPIDHLVPGVYMCRISQGKTLLHVDRIVVE